MWTGFTAAIDCAGYIIKCVPTFGFILMKQSNVFKYIPLVSKCNYILRSAGGGGGSSIPWKG